MAFNLIRRKTFYLEADEDGIFYLPHGYKRGYCITRIIDYTTDDNDEADTARVEVVDLEPSNKITTYFSKAQQLCPGDTKKNIKEVEKKIKKGTANENDLALLNDPDNWMLHFLRITVYAGLFFARDNYTVLYKNYEDEDDGLFHSFLVVREKKENGEINWIYYQHIYKINTEESIYLAAGYLWDDEKKINTYVDFENDLFHKYLDECSERFDVKIINGDNIEENMNYFQF